METNKLAKVLQQRQQSNSNAATNELFRPFFRTLVPVVSRFSAIAVGAPQVLETAIKCF